MAKKQPERNVEFFYRCSDDEQSGLERRTGDRRSAAAETRYLLNLALIEFCDEVDRKDGAITFNPVTDAESQQKLTMRKLRIPRETAERVQSLVAQWPDVSRDNFVREALRRWASKRGSA